MRILIVLIAIIVSLWLCESANNGRQYTETYPEGTPNKEENNE